MDVCELSARQTNRLGIRHRRWGPRLLYSDRSGWTVDAPWAGLPRAYRWAAAPGATAAAAPRAAAPEATAAAAPPRASWHRRQRVGRAAAAARARMRPTPTAARSGVRGGGVAPTGGAPFIGNAGGGRGGHSVRGRLARRTPWHRTARVQAQPRRGESSDRSGRNRGRGGQALVADTAAVGLGRWPLCDGEVGAAPLARRRFAPPPLASRDGRPSLSDLSPAGTGV